MDIKKLMKLRTIRQKIIVPKNNKNEHSGYFYRSAEDMLKALKPLEEATNTMLMIGTDIKHDGDDYILISTVDLIDLEDGEVIVGNKFSLVVDLSNRGMSKPQAFGAAASYAKKYALQDMFELDDGRDEDYIAAHPPKPQNAAKNDYKRVLMDRLIKDGIKPDDYSSYGFEAPFAKISQTDAKRALDNYDNYLSQFKKWFAHNGKE